MHNVGGQSRHARRSSGPTPSQNCVDKLDTNREEPHYNVIKKIYFEVLSSIAPGCELRLRELSFREEPSTQRRAEDVGFRGFDLRFKDEGAEV